MSQPPSIAYGALYLDRGEGIEHARKELWDLYGAGEIRCLFYDVIGGPDQEPSIREHVRRVEGMARELFEPDTPVAVAGSVAPNPIKEGPRPMRTAMLEALKQRRTNAERNA